MNSSVSIRVEAAIKHFETHNYEESLLNLFPAIDKTAKLRFPKYKVGVRFKTFIANQFDIISVIGFGSLIHPNCKFGNVTFQHALYKLARNNLIHEGEFSDNMKFIPGSTSTVGGNWKLSETVIIALILSVISAKENKMLKCKSSYSINLLEEKFEVNSLWGSEDYIKQKIRNKFDF